MYLYTCKRFKPVASLNFSMQKGEQKIAHRIFSDSRGAFFENFRHEAGVGGSIWPDKSDENQLKVK